MALIALIETVTRTGNTRYNEEEREQESEYTYYGRIFNSDTLLVSTNAYTFWEPDRYYTAPEDYSKPTGDVVYADCLPNTTTKREWFHTGTGDVVFTDTLNSPTCGYQNPDLPPPSFACEATYPFVISAVGKARYILEVETLHGHVHRTEWVEKGYTGEPEYVCGSASPAQIEWPGTGNKYDVIHGSGASFELLIQHNDALLRSLYTTDERKYKVNHYRNDVLYWTGYHMPDIYNTPWVNFTFHASVQAYDGLASLANRPYLSQNGERFYGRESGINILFNCLRLLELDLPVYLAVNVWEDTTDLNMEPLAQVYFDQSGYYDEEGIPLNCKEVMERILHPYNAFIRQAGGALHILRFNELQSSYKRRRATIGSSSISNTVDELVQEHEEVVEIIIKTEVAYRESVQAIYAKPALKQVTTVTQYGRYENFVLNGEFEQWAESTPLFWNGSLPAYKALAADNKKFMMGLTPRAAGVVQIDRLTNTAYSGLIRSDKGFTFSFDFTLLIDDFYDEKQVEWQVLPNLNIAGGVLTVTNPFYELPRALVNGVIWELPSGTVRSNIPLTQPNYRRIDVITAGNGYYGYVQGTPSMVTDIIPEVAADLIVVTYLTVTDKDITFGSVYKQAESFGELKPVVKIGSMVLDGRIAAFLPDSVLSWRAEAPYVWVQFKGEHAYENGFHTITGTIQAHTKSLNVPGLLSVSMDAPMLYRSSIRGVSMALDNVRFQERATNDGIERMLITGNNEGQFNTPPFEMDLYHGSGIPRTEAMITLADGSPATTFNGGYLLQENTARDILSQHARATLTLNAVLTAGISPVAVIKDPHLLGNRFFIDKFVYRIREELVAVEAQEVFGGAEDTTLPDNVRVTEEGLPRVTEEQVYRVTEG
jgi:hypothetical protein